jgi:hypothetical protein
MPMEINDLARLGAQTRIAELIAEIDYLVKAFPGIEKGPARPARDEPGRRRRKMSVATRAKMRAAWARRKAAVAGADTPASPRQEAKATKKRTISAKGKARIAAAQRKRWAKVKRTKRKTKS